MVDPETMPYLDIANQTGRSIRIPPAERKVSMGWEAGWAVRTEGGVRPQRLLRMKISD